MTRRQKNKKGQILRRFVAYYKPHRGLFALDLACAFCIALVDLVFPYVSRLSMQRLLPQGLYAAFFAVMAAMVGAYALKLAFQYIVTYWGHLLGVRMEADIRRDLFNHLYSLSFSFFDENRTGQLMSRVTGDLFEIAELAHHGPEDLFVSLVTLLGSFVILFTIRWELALVLMLAAPVFVVFTVLQRRRMMEASGRVKEKLAGINEELESSLTGVRTAKAFGNEELELEKFARSNQRFRGAKGTYYKSMAAYFSGLEFITGLLSVLVIAFGGFLIMRGKMDYVDLITFSLYVTAFLSPIRKLSNFTELFIQGMAGFVRFTQLMDVKPQVVDRPGAVDLPKLTGRIDIEHVSFRYAPEGENVLEDVTIHIAPGETVAVVGPSGGGKTTLCQLIPRFYDVTEGRILVDGHDVRQVTQRSLRAGIGIVQQDPFLFPGTIADNIRYGRPDATDEEVEEAARKAELYDDIMAMPHGFDTYVGERGVLLSGGQKQRVAIARIFLKNPPVLILDEATSALDTITETRIQSALDALAEGRTTLVIAHRLSTIRRAGRIVVIDGASIAEEGTHEELLARNGRYAALWRAQQTDTPGQGAQNPGPSLQ